MGNTGVTTRGAKGGKSHSIKKKKNKQWKKNGATVMEKSEITFKNLQDWPGKIRLYEFNMRTLFLPPVESNWHWLTRGLFCLLGRS